MMLCLADKIWTKACSLKRIKIISKMLIFCRGRLNLLPPPFLAILFVGQSFLLHNRNLTVNRRCHMLSHPYIVHSTHKKYQYSPLRIWKDFLTATQMRLQWREIEGLWENKHILDNIHPKSVPHTLARCTNHNAWLIAWHPWHKKIKVNL